MRSITTFAKFDHLEDILRIWGPNRQTLGLMPKDAFRDSIKKKWVLICLEDDLIVGYLQFRFTNRTQTLSIVHLCIEKSHRGKGHSEKMVDKLVDIYRYQARGIKLNCRSDYDKAKVFWTRYGFQPKSTRPSRGNDPSVELVTWWYSFGIQDLFSINQNDKVKAVLDFNILAKMMQPDEKDSFKEQIADLLSDWLATEVEFHYASETINELFRDKDLSRQTNTRNFLKHFTELNTDKPSLKVLEMELEKIYFGKTDNDVSDRRQLAEAIHSGFPYFITLDDGILKHRKKVLEKHQLKIVKPFQLRSEIDFTANIIDYYPNKLSANNFYTGKLIPKEREGLDDLFLSNSTGEKKASFNSIVDEIIARPTGNVTIVKEGKSIVGLIAYYEESEYLRVPIIRTKQYSLRQTIFMQNINDLLKLSLERNKAFLAITDLHITPIEMQILQKYGFFEVDNKWIRAVRKGVSKIKDMATLLLSLTKEIPELNVTLKELTIRKDDNVYLDMFSLEKMLWPLKIVDAEIPCFIIPIKPHYARELFDTKAAKAELFGVQPKLIWSKENVYYRNVKPNVEKFPARILWYASGSKHSLRSKAIVCSSYLDEVIVGPAKEMFKKHEKFGIYSWDKDILKLAKGLVGQPIKVLKFSDSEAFDHPVPLDKIKEILFENSDTYNNFQSPSQIKNSTFMRIYTLGKGIKDKHG